MRTNPLMTLVLTALLLALPTAGRAGDRSIVVASTTSTEQSGLFAYLLPMVKARTGIDVHVVAQGTGQALKTAANGDADVVLVHDRDAEEAFVAADRQINAIPNGKIVGNIVRTDRILVI